MIFALGAFDGFHLGHQRLLETAKERAAKTGTGWGVITFEDIPSWSSIKIHSNFSSLRKRGTC